MKTPYGPPHIFISAETPWAKQRARELIGVAKAMLSNMVYGKAPGVVVTGQTRMLADGSQIKVGMTDQTDDGLTSTTHIKITVPDAPPVVEEEKPPPTEQEIAPYIWIGLRTTNDPRGCLPGDGPYSFDRYINMLLWVWEPSERAGVNPEVLSAWPIFGYWTDNDTNLAYPTPMDPALLTGFQRAWRTANGMYLIARGPYYGSGLPVDDDSVVNLLRSPVAFAEDGDDLWEQVCVMDPNDAGRVNRYAARFRSDNDATAMAQWLAEATFPTYTLEPPPDVDPLNWPFERAEPTPATVLPVGPDAEFKNYFARVVAWRLDACEALGQTEGELKIITGKGRHMVVDRYDLLVVDPTYKTRAVMPLGTTTDSFTDPFDVVIPAGDNATDSGWTDTILVNPWGGSTMDTDIIPYGLNEGALPDQTCDAVEASVVVTGSGVWRTGGDGDTETCTYDGGLGFCEINNTEPYVEVDITDSRDGIAGAAWLRVPLDECGNAIWTVQEVFAALPGTATFYDADGQPVGVFPLAGTGGWDEIARGTRKAYAELSPGYPTACDGHTECWYEDTTIAEDLAVLTAPAAPPVAIDDLTCYLIYDPANNSFTEGGPGSVDGPFVPWDRPPKG